MFNQLVYSICWGKMTMSCILWTTWFSCYGSKERASDDIKSTELAVYSMLSCYRCQEDTYQVPSYLVARFLSSLMAPQMLQLPTNTSKTQRFVWVVEPRRDCSHAQGFCNLFLKVYEDWKTHYTVPFSSQWKQSPYSIWLWYWSLTFEFRRASWWKGFFY